MKLKYLGAFAATMAIIVAACGPGAATPSPATTAAPTSGATTAPTAGPTDAPTSGATKGDIVIAIELPLEGSELAASQPMINGIRLAVKDWNGQAGGFNVSVPDEHVYDDAVNGAHDPQTGAQNMTTIVSVPEIVGVIGPLNSSVALTQIPISNEAGLLQCSPANTNQGLTKPEFGALDVRSAFPDRINYIRVVTTDDYQGPAAAKFILENLGLTQVYILDDTETFGKGIADTFEEYLTANGGTVTKRDGVDAATNPDYNNILTEAVATNPEAMYFGGVTATGGARMLLAARDAGFTGPFVGPDGINDGNADTADSFLNLGGEAAESGDGAFSTLAGIGEFEGQADFNAAYEAEYGEAATGYAATAYACAQVVLDAINRAGEGFSDTSDLAGLREAVRAAAVDPSVSYETVLGSVSFDENGDTSQLIISFYKAEGGTWVFDSQLDFAQ